MDPIAIGFAAIVIWKWRFSPQSQMARLLRSATVDVQEDAVHSFQLEKLEELECLRKAEDGRCRAAERRRRAVAHVASAALVVHALVAVLLTHARNDPRVEVLLLTTLLLHTLFHMPRIWRLRTSNTSVAITPVTRCLPASYQNLNGRYIKDREASESMDPCCDLMRITGIKRYALRFILGSDVEFTGHGEFSFAAFSVIKWFKIRESYACLHATPSKHRRRDLRSGGMLGTATIADDGQGRPEVTVLNRFGGFREGTLKEVFSWPEDDVMEVNTVLENEAGRASFKQVFRRASPR